MSTAPLATPHTPSLRRSTESYGERAMRKLKEEPLVPIGTFFTVGAFTMAMIKLRRRESQSLNRWMRVRVAAQAFTIAAVCAYYWNTAKEEFEDRLQAAEAQWKKESQPFDRNTVMAKGDSDAMALASDSKANPQTPATSSSSWWRMVWLWGGSPSSSPKHQNKGGNAKHDPDNKPM
ncbi:hypothetical protein BS17DRAFT_59188 [Gyrodon lividus]|nr:hypothetical protein BS17DRAFT_59188 [Gyrodon lividus]